MTAFLYQRSIKVSVRLGTTQAKRRYAGLHMRVAVVLFALAALLVKAPSLLVPMGQDQGLYHTVAEEILHGGAPYRDAWDPKPPGVFYVHAALLAPFVEPWRPCPIGSLQPRCGGLLFGLTD